MLWDDIRKYIHLLDIPAEGKEALLELLDRICQDESTAAAFTALHEYYFVPEPHGDFNTMTEVHTPLAEQLGVHPDCVTALVLLSGLEALSLRYEQAGYSHQLFENVLLDFRAKFYESWECKGYWGIFVSGWFQGWYTLNRFQLGRFAFDKARLHEDYTAPNGRVFPAGSFCLQCHIPSRMGSMTDDARFDSYRQAYAFFHDHLVDGLLIITCGSWLLYPDQLNFLPATSNVRKFMGDFHLLSSEDRPGFPDGWRLFGGHWGKPYAELPETNSLYRAYKQYLMGGGSGGRGFGVIIFDGKNIINKPEGVSTMNKIRVGIIGTGGISHAHMNGYLAVKDRVELVACCDIDEPKARAYAERYGFPAVYTDYNEMMAKEQLDVVSVCTWNAAHKGATIAALRGGAHVLCEKPMAMNAEEAREMIAVSEETGKLLQIGFVRRFGDDTNAVQRLNAIGELGDIYYAKASYLRRDGCPGGWFSDKAYAGGGPLIDLGVHVIDLVRYLAGNPKPVSVFGRTYDHIGSHRATNAAGVWMVPDNGTTYNHDVEDLATALVTFDNGLTLQVEASFNLNCEQDSTNVQIFGTKAGVTLNGGVVLSTTKAGMYVTTIPVPSPKRKPLIAEIKGFLDAVEGKAPCRATMDDGLQLMKIIDAIYESARTGKLITID